MRLNFSKYRSKKTEYNGMIYASRFEARVAQQLDLRLNAGEFTKVEAQFRIPLYAYLANGEKTSLFAYICDFRCEKPDGSYLLVEAKGYKTDVYSIKKKILERIWLPDHPGYTFEEVRDDVKLS